MKQQFVIRSNQIRNRAIEYLKALSINEPHVVSIKPHKKNRTSSQNSLYWLWVTCIGNELGLTKDECHHQLKGRFLAKIFERDDEGYGEMVQAIREVWRKDPADARVHGRHKTPRRRHFGNSFTSAGGICMARHLIITASDQEARIKKEQCNGKR